MIYREAARKLAAAKFRGEAAEPTENGRTRPPTVRRSFPTTAVKTSNWGHFEQPSGSWAWIGPPSKKHNEGGARSKTYMSPPVKSAHVYFSLFLSDFLRG